MCACVCVCVCGGKGTAVASKEGLHTALFRVAFHTDMCPQIYIGLYSQIYVSFAFWTGVHKNMSTQYVNKSVSIKLCQPKCIQKNMSKRMAKRVSKKICPKRRVQKNMPTKVCQHKYSPIC